jgi:hypothetical protein
MSLPFYQSTEHLLKLQGRGDVLKNSEVLAVKRR